MSDRSGPPTQLDEAALARGVREGSAKAFEQLIRAYGGRLLAVTRRILRDDDLARDAVQDAFISAYRSRRTFNASSKVSTWLHRIAVNAALMKLRSQRRKPEEPIDGILPGFQDDGHHRERFVAWTEPPDVTVSRRETREAVRRAIDQLPESYRTVLLLRDIEGLDTEEAAKMLGITANAVKIRLHRARMALRALIAPEFQGAQP
ncbi:MAG TPA: sigma-70 family RNA polymerase sigma factor [Vicinamibacterales bacterium]|nr:sigma-70 family RNA polymerase sigma factor [Vicinamibacterales bacterium]